MIDFNAIEICIKGDNAERFFNLCAYHNITFYNLTLKDNDYYANIRANDFFCLKSLSKKCLIKINISQKIGLYFKIKHLYQKKVFLLLPVLVLLILIASSNLLWNVRLEGNNTITTDLLKDFLSAEGIYYGMPLEKIPIMDLKTNLRKQFPQIKWVSMYLKGTSLQVSIKENDTYDYEIISITEGENLIAPVSGIVDSVLLRQGTLVVEEGMKVKKGDIMIMGKVDVLSEDGSVKTTHYCRADGDIYLLYELPIKEIISYQYQEKEYTQNQYTKYQYLWRNEEISFIPFKIPFETYDSITEYKDINLLSIFSIPLKIQKATYYEYHLVNKEYSKEESKDLLEKKLQKIIETLTEKGVQIIEKNVKIKTNSVSSCLEGNLTLKIKCNDYSKLEENP